MKKRIIRFITITSVLTILQVANPIYYSATTGTFEVSQVKAAGVWKKGTVRFNKDRNIITNYPKRSGKELNTRYAKMKGTYDNKLRTAVLNKYGKISNTKTYKFRVVTHVVQAHIYSSRGKVVSVVVY